MVHRGWTPGAHKSHSITPPPQLERGEKNMTKGSWVEIRTVRDPSPVTVMDKIDSTWGNWFNLSPTKSE